MGQAGAAGGFVGVTEALRQLTGENLGAVVAGAKAGIVRPATARSTTTAAQPVLGSAAILTLRALAVSESHPSLPPKARWPDGASD